MNIQAGRDIFVRVRDPDRWYRIIDGWVQLRQLVRDGREVAIMLVGPGDLIVPPSAGHDLIAEALIDTTITSLPTNEDASFTRELNAAQLRLITAQHHLVTNILTHEQTIRLVTILLDLAAVFGIERDDAMVEIDLRLTDERLGRMTAANRTTVTRILLRLQADGILVKHGQGQLTINRRALQQRLTH